MDFVSQILNDENIRQSLIELKKNFNQESSCYHNEELKDKLKILLNHEDPKVRKNAAFLLGYYEDCIPLLINAYFQEKTEYVKESYLKAFLNHDCHMYLKELKMIQKKLIATHDVSTKHIQAQLKIINPLILQYGYKKKKVVKLKHEPVDVILTTLPYYQFVIFEHVLSLRYKPLSQGVLVRTESLYDLQSIRVYKDMIFPIGLSHLPKDIHKIEIALPHSRILEVLNKLYDEKDDVFYYRVADELREKNPQLVKQISQKLFEIFPHRLLNSSEKYDIEFVLREVKKGTVSIYLKLTHLSNPRFLYRKKTIANSMQPYVAATLVQLAYPYMKDNAQVLDPFTGSGILLIEKNIIKPSHFSMGVDIFNEGIEIARKNAKAAQQNIHFVHKDALRFSNNELFNEIITDMPTFPQMKDEEKLTDLYDRFFSRIHRLVRVGGYVFLYTSEISLVMKNLRLQEDYLSLEEHYDIPRGKNMFYFFIIRVK